MGDPPKQFRELGGRPILCWSARPLLEALAGPLVAVVPAGDVETARGLVAVHLGDRAERVRVVAGGDRRRDSVRIGLGALVEAATVLVHDAARPFASRGLVERVARRAAAGRAVVPALVVHDTLKEVDDDRIVRTLERRPVVAVQTPQGFPRALLADAHAADGDLEATDDARLCEALGAPVSWVEGEWLNRKLTDAGDWDWAERVVADGVVRWE